MVSEPANPEDTASKLQLLREPHDGFTGNSVTQASRLSENDVVTIKTV